MCVCVYMHATFLQRKDVSFLTTYTFYCSYDSIINTDYKEAVGIHILKMCTLVGTVH